MKRFLAGLLAMALLFSCASGISLQKVSAEDIYFNYDVEDGEAVITSVGGDPENVIIPETLDGYKVTAIGEYAFYYSNIKTVTLPDSVREIREAAFGSCGLEILNIGAGLQQIGNEAFSGCSKLSAINVSVNNPYFSSDAAGVLYNKDKTQLLRVPSAVEGRLTVAATVEEIGEEAVSYCGKLLDIILPAGLKTIGDHAFMGNGFLTQMAIPASVTSIGQGAFSGCRNLKHIYYAGTQVQWEQIAFGEYNEVIDEATVHYGEVAPEVSLQVDPALCYSYEVTDGEATITSYDESWFTDVVIPQTLGGYPVVAIGEGAFGWTGITSLVIPDTVRAIGRYAFDSCYQLKSVEMGNGVQAIGAYAFDQCSAMESLTLSNRLTSIGACAFNLCKKLTQIELPASLETLCDGAFWQCKGLTEINIPAGVTSVGAGIAQSCENLTAIRVDPANTAYSSDANGILYNKDKTVLMEAPAAVSGVIQIPESVKQIVDYAFIYCGEMTGIILPEGLETIGRDAFFECAALEEIRLPDSLQTLGDGALSFCYALTTVDFGEGIDSIGESAFNYVEELTSVVIGSNVKSIGKYAFYDCDKLTDVYYTGTEAQWNEISIGKYNDPLKNATIHYEWVRPAVPENPDTPSSGTAGDLDGVDGVNEDDVIYLLQHLLMPEKFPVNQVVDYDQNNILNEDDVIYLLQHLLMPEEFPLPESGETVTAVKILTKIWDAIPEEEKFFAIGGDMENMIDGAPGACALDPEYLTAILRVPADQVDKVTEAASLVHGMNASYFTCGAFRVTGDPAVFAEAMRDSIAGNPRRSVTADKQYVAVIDDYVVACFGTGAAMDPFEDAVEDTHPDADIIYNEQITPDNPGGGADDNETVVMTYAEYAAAAIDSPVTVECYVQATQSWWDNKICVYAQDADGAYFIYDMKCDEADAPKLTEGTKIRVSGYKGEWSGLVEIMDATFEFVEGADTFVAAPLNVTNLLGTEDLIKHQNKKVSFKGMTVVAYNEAGDAFQYRWDGSGEAGDDLYFKASVNGGEYTFCVERYLTEDGTDVYEAVEALKVGDVIDMEGFLYWYEGPEPHITAVTLDTPGGGNQGGGDSVDERPAEKVHLTVGIPASAWVLDYDDNALTNWIEETCNVELAFIQYTGSNLATQISTTIASGQRLPDILYGFPLGDSAISTYGNDGYFVDLSDYYADKTGASKHFWNRMENELSATERKTVLGKITDPNNGEMYSVPTVETAAIANSAFQPWINQTWLDKLGLDAPTNLSELYEVLLAFKNNDPNGNGVKDEIPLMGSQRVTGGKVVDWLINMFCYYDSSNPYTVDRDGKLVPVYTSDAYRQALLFVNNMYRQGLLSPMSWTMGSADMRAIFGSGSCGVVLGNLDLLTTSGNELLYQYAPLKGWGCPVNNSITAKTETFITADCDDADRAFMVLMKLWSWEGAMRVRYGEYGVNWVDADPDTKSAYGFDATYKLISDPNGTQHTAHWGKTAATLNAYSQGEAAQLSDDATDWDTYKNQLNAQAYSNYLATQNYVDPDTVCPPLYYTEDEQDACEAQRSNVNSLVSRYQTDFCMGSKDPANDAVWSAYLAELEEMGLEDVLTYAQAAYDRQK